MTALTQLPLPPFFDPARVGDLWRVPYQARAATAQPWAQQHSITPANQDQRRICLLAIDVQNTFCLPDFELFVGGRSGMGAVEDTTRLCEFVYRNLGQITEIVPTLDTHTAVQIFHPAFWVDRQGHPPAPMTLIELADVASGHWRPSPVLTSELGLTDEALTAFTCHYARRLSQDGKYPLTVWPYHSMLGGVGHALVPAFEEACFFHNRVRQHQTRFEMKGGNPLTENYSVLQPEVLEGPDGVAIAQTNRALIDHLLTFDAVIIAGQAKSHCVAWTVDDLLTVIQRIDDRLTQKIFLLGDCTSPVVVPGVVDFTDDANAAYSRFAAAGMSIIQSHQDLSLI